MISEVKEKGEAFPNETEIWSSRIKSLIVCCILFVLEFTHEI